MRTWTIRIAQNHLVRMTLDDDPDAGRDVWISIRMSEFQILCLMASFGKKVVLY